MAESAHARADRILERLPGISDRFNTAQLSLFITELLRWNPRLGLVSKKNTEQVVIDLLRRSITLWDFLRAKAPLVALREGIRVVDIGSGGGFPGVVWQLMQPEILVTVIERKARKAFFLQKLAVMLDASALTVEDKDAKHLAGEPNFKEKFEIAVMLAVAHPDEFASAIEAFLKPGGVFATLRGREDAMFPGTLGRVMAIHSAETGPEGPMLLYEKPQNTSPA